MRTRLNAPRSDRAGSPIEVGDIAHRVLLILPVFALLSMTSLAASTENDASIDATLTGPILSGSVLPGLAATDDDDDDDDESSGKASRPVPASFVMPSDVEPKAAERFFAAHKELISLLDHNVGDEDKVKRDFKKAARKLKTVPMASFYLGRLELWDERAPRAKKHFEKTLELNPQFYEAMAYLGDIYRLDDKLDKAAAEYERALAINPQHEHSLLSKYDLYLLLGKLNEARGILAELKEFSEIEWLDLADTYLAETLRPPRWPTEYRAESDNYVVRTGVSQEYADTIAACAEQVRKLYGKYFLDVPRIGRKYQIFLYRDNAEYHSHGGPRTAGGHYSPYTRNLYLFKYASHSDTMLVLYHEGFHQYLHEYLDAIPQWFNEGLGDFFGGAMINRSGSRAKMGPNPWRVDYVRQAMKAGVCPSAEELMLMTREQMYGERAGVHYAQAWAIVFYCMEGGQSKYKKALQNYFKALRKGKTQAQAYRSSFAKVDMERFERDWRNYIDKQPSASSVKKIRDEL